MNVPKLQFKDDNGKKFPEWVEKILGDTLSIFSGYAFSSNHSQSYGIKWLKISDVGIQKMIPDNPSYLPFELRDKYKNFLVFKDDYVIALTRPILNGELKIARVDQYYDGSLLNQRVGKLVSNEVIDFVYFLLQLKNTVSQITDTISGTDPPNLSLNEIKGIKLRIPSDRAEQTKIANFLTAIDEKISQLTQKCDLLTQYKKGVMQQIFSQKLRFKDEDGREFPEWKEKQLGDLCSTFKSGSGITSEKISDSAEYPVYGGNGLRGYTNTYTHDDFFVLIGRQGALCGNINRSRGKAYISEHAIAVNANETSITEWLAYKLDCMKLNRLSESSAQPGLSVNKLLQLKLIVPTKPEQTKIANFLTAIDEKISHAQTQLDAVKLYKKGLLQQMFV